MKDWITAVGDGLAFKGNLKGSLIREINEDVQEFHTQRSVVSRYATVKDQDLAYAVRFLANTDSRCYSAWRYSFEKNPESEGFVAVIRSCYLGPGAHEELKDISSESWWRNRETEVRRLPMAGRWAPQKPYHTDPFFRGFSGFYWTNTPLNQWRGHHAIFGLYEFWGSINFGAPTNYACVRLFKDL